MTDDAIFTALTQYLDAHHAAEHALRPFVDHRLAMNAQRVADVRCVLERLDEVKAEFTAACAAAGLAVTR